jgi:hypothetical protein
VGQLSTGVDTAAEILREHDPVQFNSLRRLLRVGASGAACGAKRASHSEAPRVVTVDPI